MEIPAELKYTESDEWIRGDGAVGVTDYAQDQLSDIVYFELTVAVGDTIARGDQIAILESVKAAADIYAPVGGEVTEVNSALADQPEQVNSDPYDAAWMVKLAISDASEMEALMDSAAYQQHIEDRSH